MAEKDKWVEVENSSLISGFKYISGQKILMVEFKSNHAMYGYYDVPADLIEGMDENNAGKVIKEKIISGKQYKYKKMS